MEPTRILSLILATLMSCSAGVTKHKLNNGLKIPGIALGTYLGTEKNDKSTQSKRLRDVVMRAIDIGYRHFDTAAIYDTETEIGEAVRLKIEQGVVRREDIFITSKLWNTHHAREEVTEALIEALNKMGLDYVDLYLMHWPIGLNKDYSYSDVDYMETWRGLEDVQQLGLTKSIGLSNFNKEQIKRVIEEGTIKPSVLEIEVHPQIVQLELVDYAQSKGLVVMGFSPFGSLVSRYGRQFPGPKTDDPVLTRIAQKYGKTTPQVVLRWLIDRNIIPIPKTTNYSRLQQNIDVFDFQLTEEEIEEINNFDTRTRYTLPSFWQNHPHYPFDKITDPIPDPFINNN